MKKEPDDLIITGTSPLTTFVFANHLHILTLARIRIVIPDAVFVEATRYENAPDASRIVSWQGERSGKNRIYRLYREEGLTVRKRRARRRAVGTRAPILVEAKPNARWSLDFVHDQLASGRRFAS